MIQITSFKNPLIKEVKSLCKKKDRESSGLFIVEGIKMVEEMVDNFYSIKNLFYTDSLLKNQEGYLLFSKIKDMKVLVYVSEDVFKEISDTENPQGVLATVNFSKNNIDKLEFNGNIFLLYLDKIQDPGNMGTIIRTADAFKVNGILLREGCVDPYNPKVVRSTMGSIFRVPLYFLEDGLEEINILRSKGIRVYASSLESNKDIDEIDFVNSLVIIGNESNGVSDEISMLAHEYIKIPMSGGAESLNAGVAASIIMYEAMKQNN